MMKPTLVILAAGMGSRYGGLKQLDGVGPNGETLLEYSIHDAILSGFGKVVFIIRESFESEFKEKVVSKFSGKIDTEIVFQQMENLPSPYQCPQERQKPWGTGQAVLAAAPKVKEPFAVINADDFYGQDAFKMMAKMLNQRMSSKADWCMIAYKLGKTLTENGSVSRGICSIDEDDKLLDIKEHTQIIDSSNGPQSIQGHTSTTLPYDSPVSMNFFGFTPDIFSWLDEQFKEFLKENITKPKGEFYLPAAVNQAIKLQLAQVKVAQTNANWMGVTYPKDKAQVCKEIDELVKLNYYSL